MGTGQHADHQELRTEIKSWGDTSLGLCPHPCAATGPRQAVPTLFIPEDGAALLQWAVDALMGQLSGWASRAGLLLMCLARWLTFYLVILK